MVDGGWVRGEVGMGGTEWGRGGRGREGTVVMVTAERRWGAGGQGGFQAGGRYDLDSEGDGKSLAF